MTNLKFRKRLCCSATALLSLFAVCSTNLHATNDSPQNAQESRIGKAAPEFTLTSADGKKISLSDHITYYVMLNFHSSSAESRKVNADIAKLKEQYKNADIAFIDIPLDENAEIAKQYGVSTAPAICIIKPDGTVMSIEKSNANPAQKLKEIFPL